jgi:hypothetical protein
MIAWHSASRCTLRVYLLPVATAMIVYVHQRRALSNLTTTATTAPFYLYIDTYAESVKFASLILVL